MTRSIGHLILGLTICLAVLLSGCSMLGDAVMGGISSGVSKGVESKAEQETAARIQPSQTKAPPMGPQWNQFMVMQAQIAFNYAFSAGGLWAGQKGYKPGEFTKFRWTMEEEDPIIMASVVFGWDDDRTDVFEETLKFLKDAKVDNLQATIYTPFPGTKLFEEARQNGWIEDNNWSNYDMVHAIMPTETLSRKEVQKELYECYRSFFGSWSRQYKGFFSNNPIMRRTYQYLARKAITTRLRSLF